jgi:hypothetical protein
VGAASANRGCSADTPHTAVPASVSVPIWGTPVEMLLAHETIHRLDVLASSTCNTHLPHLRCTYLSQFISGHGLHRNMAMLALVSCMLCTPLNFFMLLEISLNLGRPTRKGLLNKFHRGAANHAMMTQVLV